MSDPLTAVTLIGSSAVAGIVMYVVVDQVQTSQNVTGGLWDIAKLMLSVAPVAFAVIFVFR